jgi:hypothetical protein
MAETRSPRPVLLTVDDAPALATEIERELSDRYGEDYRVVCGASAEMGLVELERCEADSEHDGNVLADRLIELLAQLYRRVAHYGDEDASTVESGLGLGGDHKWAHWTNRIGLGAPCGRVRAGL